MTATRAYVDRPVTDLVAATSAAAHAAEIWRLEAPVMLRVGMNAIYASGPVILRVSRPSAPAEVSLDLARFWQRRGVPVPQPVREDVVRLGELSVTAWERVDEQIDGAPAPIDWALVGEVVRLVHRTDLSSVPPSVPLPSPTVFPWWDFDVLLQRAEPALDDAARAGLGAVIERHRGWDVFDDVVVCHGDVHPGNVIMRADGPVLLDWDLLCVAPAGWDHGPLLTWAERWGGRPGTYEDFARGYGRSLRHDPAATAIAELRLAAATLMRVAAAVGDPAARPEAERRLRFWRGDPDAPPWTAQ
jgi:Ser/Thr protein kinase RdoA (MazF antagonist)